MRETYTKTDSIAIARNITEKRKALNMTQRELTDLLHVSDKTVSRWETGSQVPDALTMTFDYAPVTKLKVWLVVGLCI